MVRSVRHKGPGEFFTSGSKAGIRPEHATRLRLILGLLNAAHKVQDLDFPGSRLHALHGDREGFWSIAVSGNWRVVFRVVDGDVMDVDYVDYH